MANFLPFSWRVVFGGLFGVLVTWSVFGAIISAMLVVTDWIVTVIGSTASGMTQTFSLATLTTAHLEGLKQFQYLHYYMLLWIGLIVVIAIGSLIYAISLSQDEGLQFVGDFYSDVANRAVVVMGTSLIIWILSFLVYGIFFSNYGLFTTDSTLSSIMTGGTQGMQTLAGGDIVGKLLWFFDNIYPYVPAPIFFAVYIYVLKNAHTGWAGNVYQVLQEY